MAPSSERRPFVLLRGGMGLLALMEELLRTSPGEAMTEDCDCERALGRSMEERGRLMDAIGVCGLA